MMLSFCFYRPQGNVLYLSVILSTGGGVSALVYPPGTPPE